MTVDKRVLIQHPQLKLITKLMGFSPSPHNGKCYYTSENHYATNNCYSQSRWVGWMLFCPRKEI